METIFQNNKFIVKHDQGSLILEIIGSSVSLVIQPTFNERTPDGFLIESSPKVSVNSFSEKDWLRCIVRKK